MLSLLPFLSKSLAKDTPVARYRNNAVHRHGSKPFAYSRQCSADRGIADEEAIAKGMEEKSKEFAEKGAEVHTPARGTQSS